jgi:hypothetical protein
VGESVQRLAHGGTRDTQLLGDLLLDELAVGLAAAFDDVVAQRL